MYESEYRELNRTIKGKRIRCIEMMPDPHTGNVEPDPVEYGTEGTVTSVDDMGTIHVIWDNGRTLGLIANVDKYEIL